VSPLAYDLKATQWVRCTASYVHDVELKGYEGYLFLRRLGVACLDFEHYTCNATNRAPHLFLNMAGERKDIKERSRNTQAISPSPSETDDEVEFVQDGSQSNGKRRAIGDDNRPTQRRRLSPPSSSSASPVDSSLSDDDAIVVPESCGKWPTGMSMFLLGCIHRYVGALI